MIPTQNSDQPEDFAKVTQGPLLGPVGVRVGVFGGGDEGNPQCPKQVFLSLSYCTIHGTLENDFSTEGKSYHQ